MTDTIDDAEIDAANFDCEALRVLRRLAEQGACLALAAAMDTAVVVREIPDGSTLRTAVVAREIAEAMALKGWIQNFGSGRVLRYRIAPAGRVSLRELVAREESRAAMDRDRSSHEITASQKAFAARSSEETSRYSLAESPLVVLARRRDRNGKPFLAPALVAAGERLREDFELSKVGAVTPPDWTRFLADRSTVRDVSIHASTEGAADKARARMKNALTALGPGLADVALRCCCFLEGLEATERRMGWSARSGKIVLRIALHRLKIHYDEHQDEWSPLIG